MPGYSFVRADWAGQSAAISAVRRRVFIVEQGVSEYQEWDAADTPAAHVLGLNEKRDVVGTGRVDRSGRVGRVAVLRPYRGQGVGTELVRVLMDVARLYGLARVHLNAQIQAERFYSALGFSTVGASFMEAGMVHVRMELQLEANANAEC